MSVFQEATRQRRLDSANGQQRLPWLPAGAPVPRPPVERPPAPPVARSPAISRLAAPTARRAPVLAHGLAKSLDHQPGGA